MYSGQGTFRQKIMKTFEPETAENNRGFLSVAPLSYNTIKMQNAKSFKSTVKRGGEMN